MSEQVCSLCADVVDCFGGCACDDVECHECGAPSPCVKCEAWAHV